jgi:hypothetical protein
MLEWQQQQQLELLQQDLLLDFPNQLLLDLKIIII